MKKILAFFQSLSKSPAPSSTDTPILSSQNPAGVKISSTSKTLLLMIDEIFSDEFPSQISDRKSYLRTTKDGSKSRYNRFQQKMSSHIKVIRKTPKFMNFTQLVPISTCQIFEYEIQDSAKYIKLVRLELVLDKLSHFSGLRILKLSLFHMIKDKEILKMAKVIRKSLMIEKVEVVERQFLSLGASRLDKLITSVNHAKNFKKMRIIGEKIVLIRVRDELLIQSYGSNNENGKYVVKFMKWMNMQKISRLNLVWNDVRFTSDQCLEILQEYFKTFYCLKKLHLDLHANDMMCLSSPDFFKSLMELNYLEDLALSLKKLYNTFFEGLSQLTVLKRLRLRISDQNTLSKKEIEIMVGSICNMKELKEVNLGFCTNKNDSENDLGLVLNNLVKSCKKLEKLIFEISPSAEYHFTSFMTIKSVIEFLHCSGSIEEFTTKFSVYDISFNKKTRSSKLAFLAGKDYRDSDFALIEALIDNFPYIKDLEFKMPWNGITTDQLSKILLEMKMLRDLTRISADFEGKSITKENLLTFQSFLDQKPKIIKSLKFSILKTEDINDKLIQNFFKSLSLLENLEELNLNFFAHQDISDKSMTELSKNIRNLIHLNSITLKFKLCPKIGTSSIKALTKALQGSKIIKTLRLHLGGSASQELKIETSSLKELIQSINMNLKLEVLDISFNWIKDLDSQTLFILSNYLKNLNQLRCLRLEFVENSMKIEMGLREICKALSSIKLKEFSLNVTGVVDLVEKTIQEYKEMLWKKKDLRDCSMDFNKCPLLSLGEIQDIRRFNSKLTYFNLIDLNNTSSYY